MTLLHIQAQSVNNLFHGFYLSCQVQVSLNKTVHGNIQNVMDRSFKYLQFFLCFIGKIQLFVIHFLCSLFHIAGMVGNSLKITDAM